MDKEPESFSEIVQSLAPLESFDPRAFVGDAGYSQDLCNFVLTLALAYNDFRDLFTAHRLVDTSEPPHPEAVTAAWGQHAGMRWYLVRLHAAFVHELCELIAKSDTVLNSAAFTTLVRQLPRPARESWGALVDVAFGRTTDDARHRALHYYRNKVAFHYDCKEVFKGYNAAFVGSPEKIPYLSRGAKLWSSRFYFADAAAQRYLFLRAGDDQSTLEVLLGRSVLLQQLHLSLFKVVTSFIQLRGCAWRTVNPPDSR